MRIRFAALLTLATAMLTSVSASAQPAPAKFGTPGAQHRMLAALAGDWTVEQSLWIDPEGAPQIDHGKATLTMVLGGRHLRQNLFVTTKDKDFEGLGYIGYDDITGKYFSSWMDINFTGLIVAEGDYDQATNRYTFSGTAPDIGKPGAMIPLREVLTVADKNHFTYEYLETRNGKESLAVKLVYSRAP